MQTVPLTKTQLIEHLETALLLLRDGSCPGATISWQRNTFGQYDCIAFVEIEGPDGELSMPIAIGDVNG